MNYVVVDVSHRVDHFNENRIFSSPFNYSRMRSKVVLQETIKILRDKQDKGILDLLVDNSNLVDFLHLGTF